MTLEEFLQKGRSDFRQNAWVTEPGFKALYVRLGPRWIRRVFYPRVLDLANMEPVQPGRGAFTRLVVRLGVQHPHLPLYVENVLTERFCGKLEELGFHLVDNGSIMPLPRSYFRTP